ncbi:FAD:protein FMN transferase [Nocardioides sp. YIM 152588]|uniref:FAD:protein FMN transferase n=1 Tax=Nocardioides sp. YIM 152588 TaxID=3158259 RepID=UPI0032E42CF4
MSALQWRDWSCAVRVVLADGRPHAGAPAAADGARAERVVRGLMDDVALAASRFRTDSDLSRINAAAGSPVPVGPLTIHLVRVALDAARATGGACDPTVGRHLEAAGYVTDIEVLRSFGATAGRSTPGGRPAPRADHTAVLVDAERGRVSVPAGLALDLGSTAKAWTADEAARRVAATLGVPALVSIGGDVASSGEHSWPVLVSEHEGGPGEVVPLARGGIATSSTRSRRWAGDDGEDRHHVIDPATGLPTDGAVRTATVLAATCAEANALSTAALVWGTGAADRLRDHAARLVLADGRVVTTAGWPHGEVAA